MKISRLFVAISVVLCVCLGVLSCKKEAPEDAAAQMALTCYQHLIAEEYDAYLQAMVAGIIPRGTESLVGSVCPEGNNRAWRVFQCNG